MRSCISCCNKLFLIKWMLPVCTSLILSHAESWSTSVKSIDLSCMLTVVSPVTECNNWQLFVHSMLVFVSFQSIHSMFSTSTNFWQIGLASIFPPFHRRRENHSPCCSSVPPRGYLSLNSCQSHFVFLLWTFVLLFVMVYFFVSNNTFGHAHLLAWTLGPTAPSNVIVGCHIWKEFHHSCRHFCALQNLSGVKI